MTLGVVRVLGFDDGHAAEQQRLAVDEARERGELRPRRRQRAGADDERRPAERLGERLRDAEPRVDVLAVDPDEHARAGGRDGSRELAGEALPATARAGRAAAPRSTPSSRSSQAWMPVR